MNKPSAESLIKFFQGRSSTEEENAIKIYLAMDIDKEYIEACLDKAFPDLNTEYDASIGPQELDRVWLKMERNKRVLFHKPRKSRRWYRYAAAIGILMLFSTVYIVNQSTRKSEQEYLVKQTDVVLPGSNKAVLTLADGSNISLSDAVNGKITEQEGLPVEKTAEGEIVYRANDKTGTVTSAFNSIATPNGGQYRITLPDGSKAWLNAASSLTYPLHFSENERRVKMTGEVYFEVAKVTNSRNLHVPFFVETEKQEIQVLGTQFNVTAYTDESYIRTTLVEGSVRVRDVSNGQSVLLKPGQQTILDHQLIVQTADIQQQLAWKNGEFIFKGEYLRDMLKQVARWYDLEIDCPTLLGQTKFTGIISRSTPLPTLVKMIESTREVNIAIKGRRLIVSE